MNAVTTKDEMGNTKTTTTIKSGVLEISNTHAGYCYAKELNKIEGLRGWFADTIMGEFLDNTIKIPGISGLVDFIKRLTWDGASVFGQGYRLVFNAEYSHTTFRTGNTTCSFWQETLAYIPVPGKTKPVWRQYTWLVKAVGRKESGDSRVYY